MKSFLITSAMILSSSFAMAQPIHLAPGASVYINGDTITCEGSTQTETLPVCSIRQEGYNNYRLYADEHVVETFNSFNQAVEGAKKMKEAKLCR